VTDGWRQKEWNLPDDAVNLRIELTSRIPSSRKCRYFIVDGPGRIAPDSNEFDSDPYTR